ncbi:hypothetical protein ACFW9L_32370 [Streptomyces sp. NPDC059517]|uniref:hypothetical protein n=1 Tax=Streptomyces sp. NPDC059517 TaxID=3346855 RepID=UPI003696E11F
MSEPAGPAGAGQTSSCCAAIDAWRQRAQQRTEQHAQADSEEDLATSSTDTVRDA